METITIKSPDECSLKELAVFCALLEKLSPVMKNGLLDRIKKSTCLVQLTRDCTLVGTAALKNPNPGSRQTVEEGSGIKLPDDKFPYEIGYVTVDEPCDGLGFSHCLVAAVLTRIGASGVYATTSSAAMSPSLVARGFEAVGEKYDSIEVPGTKLQLFIRPARPKRERPAGPLV